MADVAKRTPLTHSGARRNNQFRSRSPEHVNWSHDPHYLSDQSRGVPSHSAKSAKPGTGPDGTQPSVHEQLHHLIIIVIVILASTAKSLELMRHRAPAETHCIVLFALGVPKRRRSVLIHQSPCLVKVHVLGCSAEASRLDAPRLFVGKKS